MYRRHLLASAAVIASATLLPTAPAFTQSAEIEAAGVAEMTLGNPDADVTVIEYASFTCPHCRNFHENVFKDLKANYIDNGKIHFVYREVYFDRFGLWAAMLARCAGEERYFALADLIYETQSDWTAGGDPAAIADNLRKLGLTAGMSKEEIDVCLQDGDKARALVAVYQENAKADDVNSTPTFIIDGKKYGNMSYAEFAAILDERLGS